MKAWIAGALLVAMAGTASADDDELAPRHFNYRRDLILADSLSLGTVAAATAAGTWMFSADDFHLPLMIGAYGFGGYALAAPVIHMSRGNLGRGVLSLGLRILSPSIMGAVLATASGKEENDPGYDNYVFGGMAIGGRPRRRARLVAARPGRSFAPVREAAHRPDDHARCGRRRRWHRRLLVVTPITRR